MAFEWSDIGNLIGDAAPLVVDALTGNIPGAIAVGAKLLGSAFGVAGTPDALQAAITADPNAAEKLAEVESNNKVALQQLAVQAQANALAADTARMQAVNTTLQAEAQGKSWLEQNTHSICMLATVAMVIAIYAVLPMCGVPVPTVPETAFVMLGAILGVTAWHTGTATVQAVKSQGA